MITTYVTSHQHSQVIAGAFAKGIGTAPVSVNKPRATDACVYGLLRGCGDIVRNTHAIGLNYLHIDNGYFRPGHYNGYFRLTSNGLQNTEYNEETIAPADRWEKLDAGMRPWRRRGKRILLVPPSDFICKWNGFDRGYWTSGMVEQIENVTDREIIIKHEKGNMQGALEDVWCVVTYHSMAAVHALREGIPAVVNQEHCAFPVSWDVDDIEQPHWPDREPWAHWLAYHQFTVPELAAGEWQKAWEKIY